MPVCLTVCPGLRNDHKEVMKLVEEKLHELHAKARESGGGVNIGSSSSSSSSSPPGGEVKGFATVNQVSDSSPAAHAVSVFTHWYGFSCFVTPGDDRG